MESYYEKVKKIIEPGKVYDLNDKITFAAVPLNKIRFKEKDLFYFAKGDGEYSFVAPNKNSDSNWKLLYHALPVMQKPASDKKTVLEICKEKYKEGMIVKDACDGKTFKILDKPFFKSILDNIYANDGENSRMLFHSLSGKYAEILSVPSSTKSNDDRVVGFGAAMMAAQQANSFSSRLEREMMGSWKDNMSAITQRGYINPYDNKSYFPPLSTLRSPKQEDESNPFLLNKKSKKKLNENIQSPKSITLKIKK